jgi:hypothetical protein
MELLLEFLVLELTLEMGVSLAEVVITEEVGDHLEHVGEV